MVSTVDQSTETGGAKPVVVNREQEHFVVKVESDILESVCLVLGWTVVGVEELDSEGASAYHEQHQLGDP